jgi:hypothetical protein
LGGLTLLPGTYKTAAAIDLTGTLILDDNGESDPQWIFIIGGAFTTAANSQMVGDGTDANVQWVVTGAISLGANSNAIGSMKTDGAINVGAGATCGDLDAGGAIAIGANAVYASATTPGALTIGAGASIG